jgi:hypothetical protein
MRQIWQQYDRTPPLSGREPEVYWPSSQSYSLLAWYPAGTFGSGTAIHDCVRFQRTLTLSNMSFWRTNEYGAAFAPQGVYFADRINADMDLTRFTLMAWIKPESFANYRFIFTKGNYTSSNLVRNWDMDVESAGKLRCYFTQGSGNFKGFTCNTAMTANRWYHVAMRYDGTNLKGYLNGVEDGTLAVTGNPDTSSATHTVIGAQPSSPSYSNFFVGDIMDVRVYDSAIPTELIQQSARSELRFDLWKEKHSTFGSTDFVPQLLAHETQIDRITTKIVPY